MESIKIKFSLLLFTLNILSYGQDTIFLDKDKNPIEKRSAEYFKITFNGNKIDNRTLEELFLISGQKVSETRYFIEKIGKTQKIIMDGVQKTWYENGKIKVIETRLKGNLNDSLNTFWDSGTPKRKDYYHNGKLINGKCFDINGNEIQYFDFEIFPEYPGGDRGLMESIYNNIRIPGFLREIGGSVRVIAKFIVDEKGEVTDIKIIEGYNKETNNEVIRVLSLLKRWKPALQDGEPVRVTYSVPVNFIIK